MTGFITATELLRRYEADLPDPPTHDSNPEGRRLSFDDLAAREPRLADLRRFVAAQHPGGTGYCANRAWFQEPGFKAAMSRLVGDFAEQGDAALRTGDAYDTAYRALYDALPNCQHEGSCYTGRRGHAE